MPKDAPAEPLQIVNDPARIDFDRVYRWISAESYWAAGMPRATFDRAMRHSLCFGALQEGETIGFARVITDRATFAHLSDVWVEQARRGQGISRALMDAVDAHPELQNLRRFTLATRDAHGLYAKYGFTPLAAPDRLMERRDFDVYKRLRDKPA